MASQSSNQPLAAQTPSLGKDLNVKHIFLEFIAPRFAIQQLIAAFILFENDVLLGNKQKEKQSIYANHMGTTC